MSYVIEWEFNSKEEIIKLDKKISIRILDKLEQVKEKPEHYMEKLKDMPEFKIRIGDYRVILLWDKQDKKLKIQTIAHRKNIYKRYKTD